MDIISHFFYDQLSTVCLSNRREIPELKCAWLILIFGITSHSHLNYHETKWLWTCRWKTSSSTACQCVYIFLSSCRRRRVQPFSLCMAEGWCSWISVIEYYIFRSFISLFCIIIIENNWNCRFNCWSETHDGDCQRFAIELRAVVVSVDFRLLPEHKIPTPQDDVFTALLYLMRSAARWNIDASRIAVAGRYW